MELRPKFHVEAKATAKFVPTVPRRGMKSPTVGQSMVVLKANPAVETRRARARAKPARMEAR